MQVPLPVPRWMAVTFPFQWVVWVGVGASLLLLALILHVFTVRQLCPLYLYCKCVLKFVCTFNLHVNSFRKGLCFRGYYVVVLPSTAQPSTTFLWIGRIFIIMYYVHLFPITEHYLAKGKNQWRQIGATKTRQVHC